MTGGWHSGVLHAEWRGFRLLLQTGLSYIAFKIRVCSVHPLEWLRWELWIMMTWWHEWWINLFDLPFFNAIFTFWIAIVTLVVFALLLQEETRVACSHRFYVNQHFWSLDRTRLGKKIRWVAFLHCKGAILLCSIFPIARDCRLSFFFFVWRPKKRRAPLSDHQKPVVLSKMVKFWSFITPCKHPPPKKKNDNSDTPKERPEVFGWSMVTSRPRLWSVRGRGVQWRVVMVILEGWYSLYGCFRK